NGLDPIDVTATNNDNETPGFTIAPSTSRLNRLITSEGGMEAAFTIVLNSTPTADVTLPLSVSDISEASINKTSLTFTIYNWNAPQTVVVSGLDDDIPDGNTDYTVITGAASSIDTNYNAITPGDIFLKNTDNEQAGVTFDPIGLSKSPLITTESGGEITYTITLNSPPTDDVVIDLTSNDTLEGIVSPFSLTFTAANWNIAQTVTVTGVDDVIADGHQPYHIRFDTAVSLDPDYDGLKPDRVYCINADNE
ncbi:MAG: calcium-binding protein, partial [Spirochaetes bacterium]|nr:calcium-binding protein [Spirochaetota bacterium]